MGAIRRRRWPAVIGLLAAAALATSGLATPAFADPTIDSSLTGQINLTKYESKGVNFGPGDGKNGPDPANIGSTPDDLDSGKVVPLAGAGFTAWKIAGIDTTTVAGRSAAQKLSTVWNEVAAQGLLVTQAQVETFIAAYVPQGGAAGDLSLVPQGSEQTTDASGKTQWDDIPLGLYLIIETTTPPNHSGSAPFIVAVPITDPQTTDTWIVDNADHPARYVVNVFPKNNVGDIFKSVQDGATTTIGDTIGYTVTTGIPASPDASKPTLALDGYQVRDTLDPNLEYKANSITVGYLPPDADEDTAPTPIDPSNYTLTVPPTPVAIGRGPDGIPGTADDVFDANTVQVTFNADGLALLGAQRGGKVVITFDTTVISLPDSGVISNTALLFPDKSSMDSNEPGGTSPQNDSKFGGIDVTKTAADSGDAQADAEFEVWLDVNHNGKKDDGDTRVNVGVGPDGIAGTADDGIFRTDADGKVTISGLRYSAWWGNAAHEPLAGAPSGLIDPESPWTKPDATDEAATDVWNNWNSYLLVETKAPGGYELQADGIPFIVDGPAESSAFSVVDNQHNGGFKLPFTGGTGSTLLYAGGLLLLISAGAVGFVSRRRRSTER